MLNNLKKTLILTIIILLSIHGDVKANEEDNEDIDFSQIWNEYITSSTKNTDEPTLNSRAAIILDRETETVLYEKNAYSKRAMASTTKIMTAILTIESGKLNDIVEVSKKAASIGGSVLGLKTGDKISLNDLLYGLMLRSGNDAAVQIAEYLGGSVEGFADMMNQKAKELNLINTHFVTPHGLDNPEHYTTAYELAKLTDYAMNNKTFAKIVNTKQCSISINGNQKSLNNTNELLGVLNGVNGVKTGFTNNAGRCLVTSITRDNWSVICVVLSADTKKFRTKDSISLIEYTYKNFERYNIEDVICKKFEDWKSENIINVEKGKDNFLETKMSDIKYDIYPVKKEKIKDLNIEIDCIDRVEAPIKQDDKIGELILSIGDDVIERVDILCGKTVDKKDIFYYYKDILFNMGRYMEEYIN